MKIPGMVEGQFSLPRVSTAWSTVWLALCCCFAIHGTPQTAATPAPSPQPVRVWQDRVKLPTYSEGFPNEIAHFSVLATDGNFYYPYATRDNLGIIRHDEFWRTLDLQNEYLHCNVMPDLGGRIYRCLDLSTGKDIFYSMTSIKKHLSGGRGTAMTSGVEFQFPTGSGWVSVSPVDYALSKNPDGSGSIWIGSIDDHTGMQWRVELVLRPRRRVLEQHVTLYNRSVARQPFHWGLSAAVPMNEHTTWISSSRIMTPEETQLALQQAGTSPDSATISPSRNRDQFFGIYDLAAKQGVIHFADPSQLPEHTVAGSPHEHTGDNTTFVTLRAGMPRAFLYPQESRTFTEYWEPVSGMDGVSQASLDAILYLGRKTNGAEIQLRANRLLNNVRIQITQAGRTIWEARKDLNPAAVLSYPIDADSRPLSIDIVDETGGPVLHYDENRFPATKPPDSSVAQSPQPNAPDVCTTPAACLDAGRASELAGNWFTAKDQYIQALRRFGNLAEALAGVARTDILLHRMPEVIERYAVLARLRPLTAEEQYYRGLAETYAATDGDAAADFASALGNPAFESAARLEQSRIQARAGKWSAALAFLQPLTSRSPALLSAGELEVAYLRKSGDLEHARNRLRYWQQQDPTDVFLQNESLLLGTNSPGADSNSLWAHLSANPRWVLRLAHDYLAIGDTENALAILDRAYPVIPDNQRELGLPLPQDDPLVIYYRAYCHRKLGTPTEPDTKLAQQRSTRYVFPSGPLAPLVLRSALEINPGDRTALFLLSTWRMEAGYVDDAAVNWQELATAGANFPGLYFDLAQAQLLKDDRAGAIEWVKRGLQWNPSSRELKDFAAKLNPVDPTSVAASTAGRDARPEDYASLVLSDAAAGRTADALQVFTANAVRSIHTSQALRRAYYEVLLKRVIDLARTKTCSGAMAITRNIRAENPDLPFTGGGGSDVIDTPRAQFFLGRSQALCGYLDSALKYWTKAAAGAADIDSADYVFPLFAQVQLDAMKKKIFLPQLRKALETVEARMKTQTGAVRQNLKYSAAMLEQALGRFDKADEDFKDIVVAAGPELQYRGRIGLRDNAWAKSARH